MIYENLLSINTPFFDVSLRGAPPDQLGNELRHFQAGATATTMIEGTVEQAQFFHSEIRALVPLAGPHPPLFFEESPYELIVELKQEGEFSFWHLNPELRNAIRPVGQSHSRRHPRIYSGILDFRGEIGESELLFFFDQRQVLSVSIEVFPRKLDYRQDFTVILLEVHSQVHGLAFEILTKTFGRALPDPRAKSTSASEWLSLLEYLMANLERAVRYVAQKPNHRLVAEERLRPLDRVRRTNGRARAWARHHPEVATAITDKLFLPCPASKPPQLPEVCKRVNYDTPENRFVYHVLEETQIRLKHLQRLARSWGNNPADPTGPRLTSQKRQEQLLQVLGRLERRTNNMLSLPLFRQVGPYRGQSNLSLVLQFGPGYREVLVAYLVLKRGLSIQGRALRIGLKSLPELYEYWCFLRLREILAANYPMVSQDIVRTTARGLTLALAKGKASQVIFRGPQGSAIELGYNFQPEIPSPTTEQRPDMLLTLDRHSPGGHHRYIFDAKYRLGTEPSYISRFGGIGPKEEDINTMHRYRDAFLWGDPAARWYSRDALGACVLFPWSGEFSNHHFYRSLYTVGIGALPFLPGNTQLVEEFLQEILGLTDAQQMDRALLPRGHEVFFSRRYRNDPVLVGTLAGSRQRQRLEFIRTQGYYHIPVDKISAQKMGFSYLALFCDGEIKDWARVIDTRVVPERELPGITKLRPLRDSQGQRLYYQVDIDPSSWQTLPAPITNPQRLRFDFIATTLEALLTAHTLGELRLRHELERRLIDALRAANWDYQVMATDSGRPEILVAVGETSLGRIRPQASRDGVEIWLPGAAQPRRIPGSIVRQRPAYVLKVLSQETLPSE